MVKDDIVALLPDLTRKQVEEMCGRIERVVSSFSLHVRAETSARVGISVGASAFGLDGETLDQLGKTPEKSEHR